MGILPALLSRASDGETDRIGCIVGILLMVSFFLGVVVLARWGGRKYREEVRVRRALGERLAARLKGILVPDPNEKWIAVEFEIDGRPAGLECLSAAGDDPAVSRLAVDVRGLSRGALKIFPQGFPDLFKRLFRMQDIVIGDGAFDKDYIVQATPETVAWRLFSRERRSRVIGTIRWLGRLGGHCIDLGAERLEVKVAKDLEDEASILSLVQIATEFLGYLVEMAPAVAIHWIRVEEGKSAQCLVCGTALQDGIVRCKKCRTPHHEDCWRYARRCATYGCGGRRAAGT